jgi:hypothetical protein
LWKIFNVSWRSVSPAENVWRAGLAVIQRVPDARTEDGELPQGGDHAASKRFGGTARFKRAAI